MRREADAQSRIIVQNTCKCKATTDSDHMFKIVPNLLERDFTAEQPNQKWAGDISYIGPARAGSIWR